MTDETELIIPDYDPCDPKPYPGDITPGYYNKAKVMNDTGVVTDYFSRSWLRVLRSDFK